ncbi:IclR family transcriptional regulator [Microlunatus speluncae]|uniref:IclR family transcriptional regulator n=1 Tax=Microlunatus speluncae TaxID=2594267 RepID=UPI0012661FFD|nr:IclR family transcriptional regulator [Microlunatus speluncae]
MAVPDGLQSVDRLTSLLDAVAAEPGPLAVIAARAGLSEPTALRYLNSVVRNGWVERDPRSRHYRIGMRLFALSRSALGRQGLMGLAGTAMATIVDTCEETATLGVRTGDQLVIAHAVESRQPIRKGATIGETDAWHSTGLGKAILSTLPEAEVRETLRQYDFEATTRRTITSVKALLSDLATVRGRGYAIDDEESVIGLRCVAVPVRDHSGTARYALSVSGPSDRVPSSRLGELAGLLRKQVDHLELFLGFE